jgi:cytochrome c
MKKVLIALTIAAACYACGGGEATKESTPVSNNEGNGNSSIGGGDSGSAANTTPATETPASTPSTTVAAASGKDGKALIEASDCRTCHKDDAKLIGPSYQDVAKKYENNEKNVKMLADKVLKGGSGVWGEIPMAGHPNVSEEDAKAMVTYILSMKK